MNIRHFLDQLDTHSSPIPLKTIMDQLGRLDIDRSDIREYMRFDKANYQRNFLHGTANYEALLLCFEAGQRTPIHDHAGSACGVKVVEGTGVETIFQSTSDGWLFATGSHELPQGGVVGSNDMDTHQLSNLQTAGQRLVTLHIYSPPLGIVGNYSITDNSVTRVKAPTRETVLVSDVD